MITDEDILIYFCGKKLKNIQRKKINENIPIDIQKYLLSRYNDSQSFLETIIRIVKHIDIHPLCPICGKPRELNKYKPYFNDTCGDKHCINKLAQIKHKNTMLNNFGYEYTFCNKDILNKAIELSKTEKAYENRRKTCQEKYGCDYYTNRVKASQTYNNKTKEEKQIIVNKAKQTKFKLYGDENYNNIEQAKQTIFERYGVTSYSQTDECKEKIHNTVLSKYGVDYVGQIEEAKIKSQITCLKKYGVKYGWNNNTQIETIKQTYGVDNVWKSDIIKQKIKDTNLQKYGSEHWSSSEIGKHILSKINSDPCVLQKRYNTCIKNNSFNKSKPEDICYELLKEKFPDVLRQYKEDRYPFKCDFYIPSKDLFIEFQGSQYHHGHPYLGTEEDLLEVERIKESIKTNKRHLEGKKCQGDAILNTWTRLDPLKRQIAKDNNLNYKEFWSINDVKEFLNYF